MILNGIEDIVARPDLADRAMFLTLEPIREASRRSEQELWAAFGKERPRILGVLLDPVVWGLHLLPQTQLDRLPRMADFALWATACETAFWPASAFWAAYCGNCDEAVEGVIDADPVASAVRATVAARTEWTGTASDLLGALGEVAGETARKSKTWPDTPRALAGRLRRAATFLRKVGIEIVFQREGRARTRTIHIATAPDNTAARPSAPSALSATAVEGRQDERLPQHGPRMVASGADDSAVIAASPAVIVRNGRLKANGGTHADGADANVTRHSSEGEERTSKWTARL